MKHGNVGSINKRVQLKGMQKAKAMDNSGAIIQDAHSSSRDRDDQAKRDHVHEENVLAGSRTEENNSDSQSAADSGTTEEQVQILINSDHNIETSEKFSEYVRSVITHHIHNFQSQITRIEVHLTDENAAKEGGNDKRCVMEARLAGRKPMAVTAHANTVDGAVDDAAEKLKHALTTIMGREHRTHPRNK